MRRFAIACGALAALASPSLGRADLRVEIDAAAELGPVQRDVYGANLEYIGAATPEIEGLVAGTPLLRFPGGDDVSQFLWSDSTAGTCAQPRWTWDAAARFAARTGSGLVLETNAVRGTPANTAAWVADARARGLRVAYVEIGNEVWGPWDAGYRTAARYADDVRAHAAAVRAVAPGTRVLLEIGTFNEDAWNREAVRRTADVIDAVDYHYYPNHLSAPDPLSVAAGADGVAPLLARLRAMLREEAGAVRGDALDVVVGEWDGASDPPRGTAPAPGVAYAQWAVANALFYGAAIGEMLRGGVAAAMFYEVQGYRFGAVNGGACTPADLSIRRPKELALRLYREHFGDRLVAVRSEDGPTFRSAGPTNWDGFAGEAPFVKTYASAADDGSLRVVVVNRDPTSAHVVDFALQAFSPAPRARAWELAGDSMMATNENVGGPTDAVHVVERDLEVAGPAWVFTAPAHSITLIQLPRAAKAPDAGDAAPGDAPSSSVTSRGDAAAAFDATVDGAPLAAPPPTTRAAAVVRAPSRGCGAAGGAGGGAVAALALTAAGAVARRRRRHQRAP